MWFKNLQLYRLTGPWLLNAEELALKLQPFAFSPCTSLDLQSQGWVMPCHNGGLVHSVSRQMLLSLRTEKKLLPASVVNQVTLARALEMEEQQGHRPGRKQMRELREKIADELLPRAFSIEKNTCVWIDPVHGWLAVDSASPSVADNVFKLLLKAIDKLPVEGLRTIQTPVGSMTSWLSADEAPAGFTIDQDAEFRAQGDSKATVRYSRNTLGEDDVKHHLQVGKQCTRIGMTWNDKVSFVLTENFTIKRLAALDVLKESAGGAIGDESERFDSDFILMTGELHGMLTDLVSALGGVSG
jgi:recombination associated protein RdgC